MLGRDEDNLLRYGHATALCRDEDARRNIWGSRPNIHRTNRKTDLRELGQALGESIDLDERRIKVIFINCSHLLEGLVFTKVPDGIMIIVDVDHEPECCYEMS